MRSAARVGRKLRKKEALEKERKASSEAPKDLRSNEVRVRVPRVRALSVCERKERACEHVVGAKATERDARWSERTRARERGPPPPGAFEYARINA